MAYFSKRRFGWLGGMLAAVIALGGVALATDSGRAHALTNCTVGDYSIDGEEAQFLTLINNYRAQNGLGALTLSTNLNRSATWMVVDMATKNYFSHTDSLGRSPGQRAIDCGYPQGAGENLAAGTVRDTAQEAFDAWKASSGHNANMLTSYYQQIGIARYYGSGSTYGWYWATEFGTTNDGTSGGGTTPPPPTTTPTAAKASMTSPAAGSTLPGSTATFNWNSGSGVQEYFLYVGTGQGANNLFGRSMGSSRSATVSGLPTNGSTLYVRLWSRLSSGWQYNDYTYRAATSTPPPTTTAKASMTSPTPGTTLYGKSATFQWSAGTGAQEYFVYVGTVKGSNNLYGRSAGTGTSATVTTLPASGATVYVRLWTRLSTGWTYVDYSYVSR